MKSPLSAAFATCALLFAGCTAPAAPEGAIGSLARFQELPLELHPPGEPAAGVTFHVEPGDSRERVLTACGRPDAAINANLWVYKNCYSPAKAARAADCDTLVIAFLEDRVIGLKLVKQAELDAVLAKLPRSTLQANAAPPR